MKEYILKNKKCLVNHVITLGILLVGFILGRYVFFDVHGMKEFPVVLLVLGLVVMVISVLTTKKILPYFISMGYIIGFVFGFTFQVTKMDANGVSVNNLWVIWAVVYVAFIVLGLICEWCFRKYGSSVDWKKNKSTKVIIAILGIVVLWLCVGIVDFALVHNYRKPLFCVGVDLADDGGSGRYVGLGYSFEIEGNFMPDVETPATGAEKPKVTSYRGYIFGKEVSRGFWDEMLPTPYKNMNDVIENAPSIQGNVTEVHETYMIIHIVTSGYPYGADCSVSLTPVYEDSYTDVSAGDEVVVYFDGNIMETDPLQLGTVYAITLRTPAERNGTETNSIAFSELAPGEEEKYFTDYYVVMDDAWLDYSITYERAAMTVVVGLRAEDGTEYSKEITGGDEKGTITGIQSGTYEVFVRNSESNADYEDTTIESLNVTGAMNFVAGQKLPKDMSYSSKAYPVTTNEPPELVVICGEEQVTALKGTYSWKYSNEDGTCTGVEADSAHPLECKEIMPELQLPHSNKSSIDVFKANFRFGITPDEVEVHFWGTDCWNMPSEEGYELEVQAIEADYVDGSYSTNYYAKLWEQNIVYEVIAKWTSSEEYSGTVHYSFYTAR